MIVVDASAVFDLLMEGPAAGDLANRLLGSGEVLLCPHLMEVEVVHTLRRRLFESSLAAARAEQALQDLAGLQLLRVSHGPLLRRMWELRHGLSAYDAAYVVLAETTGVPLVTRDARLARSTGHRARIELV